MSLDIFDVFYATIGFIGLLYLYGIWEGGYFTRKGIKILPTSRIPFVGNMMPILKREMHFKEALVQSYRAFPGERYVGFQQFINQTVILTDLELIKQVAIKDFDHFTDHVTTIDENCDPLFGKSLFSLKGQKWRDMRATLSPAFTSSKMRNMFEFVSQCGNQMTDYYLKQIEEKGIPKNGSIEVEMKDAFTRYANDVIATSAFGLEVNSLEQRDNEFYTMGKSASDFSGLRFFKFFGFISFPRIMKLFNVSLFSEENKQFFRSLVADTMAERERNHVFRPDMIQLLMEAKKGSLKHEKTVQADAKEAGFATVEESHVGQEAVKREWSNDDIAAQAILFFVAGFETASTLLCFIAHELTINPDIQKKLQEEIDSVATRNKGKLHYQDLQGMTYMDCVVSETLRLWPPAIATDRKCIKAYTLPPPNDNSEKDVEIHPGDGFWIPIYAMHRNPQYFKDPEKFDPERFSEERKGEILPFSYLPFGIGPRNCIGSRFALMEAKSIIFHLLQKFDFVRTTKTRNPLRFKMDSFNLSSKDGYWIGLKPRG